MSPPVPNSIDVWACSTCGRWSLRHFSSHLHAGPGEPLTSVEPVRHRYMLAETTEEMVERAMDVPIPYPADEESWPRYIERVLSAALSTQEVRGV